MDTMDSIDTTSSSDHKIKTKEEVDLFLTRAKALIDASSWQINNTTWKGKSVNKTQRYLAEKNISDDVVAKIIKELQVYNYSYTANDRNCHFPDEEFWFWGITKTIVDTEEDYYIKLKIRKFEDDYLLVMSFHPEQPRDPADKLSFPYAE